MFFFLPENRFLVRPGKVINCILLMLMNLCRRNGREWSSVLFRQFLSDDERRSPVCKQGLVISVVS